MGAGDGAIFTRHTAQVGGFTITYLKGGAQRDLEPVLFLHGLGGAGKWESFHMALGTVTMTLVPVLPGWQEGQAPLTSVGDYARLMAEFLDAVGLARVILAGHSIGGWIAMHLATEHPERISRLVLIAPMGLDVPEAATADLASLDEEEFGKRTFGKLGLIATANPYGFGAEWQSVRQGQEFERQWKGSGLVAQLAGGRHADPALTDAMRSVRFPTLLVWGREDGIVPARQGELLHSRIAGSTLVLVDRAGHLPMVEKPETMNRVVRDFLIGIEEAIPGASSV